MREHQDIRHQVVSVEAGHKEGPAVCLKLQKKPTLHQAFVRLRAGVRGRIHSGADNRVLRSARTQSRLCSALCAAGERKCSGSTLCNTCAA